MPIMAPVERLLLDVEEVEGGGEEGEREAAASAPALSAVDAIAAEDDAATHTEAEE